MSTVHILLPTADDGSPGADLVTYADAVAEVDSAQRLPIFRGTQLVAEFPQGRYVSFEVVDETPQAPEEMH